MIPRRLAGCHSYPHLSATPSHEQRTCNAEASIGGSPGTVGGGPYTSGHDRITLYPRRTTGLRYIGYEYWPYTRCSRASQGRTWRYDATGYYRYEANDGVNGGHVQAEDGEAGVSLHRDIETETEWARLAAGSRSRHTGSRTLWQRIRRPPTETWLPDGPLLDLRRASSGQKL